MRCKRKRQEKEEMAEKCFFMCKDSGHDLRICDSSYEDDGDAPVIKKRPRKKRPRNSLEPKIVSEINKRHFAYINQHNINLIYLRKTLVISLLSQPDTFEQKVVGCFVRVRCSKMVLGQVTDIKRYQKEYEIKDTRTHILLCVTGLLDDVSISMLSDQDLTEDECEDLISLAEEGLLKRATVAELEEKVATVHTDIVNHWIERELLRLERKIDIAQLKGLHREMLKLLKQKNLLNTPSERQRRLEEVPEVVPDTEYKEPTQVWRVKEHKKEKKVKRVTSVDPIATKLKAPRRPITDDSILFIKGAAHQVVDSLNVLNGESSKVATEQIHDCLNLLSKEESSEALSKQCDATLEEVDLGVDWSWKRGAQSSSEMNEPKKPRLSEEHALPPAGLSGVSLVGAIGPSSTPRQGPVRQEGEERAREMPPPRVAEAAETGGSALSPGKEDTGAEVPTVKWTPVVALCLDAEARPSPRLLPVADVLLELQELVPAGGANVGDGLPPEGWAEPAAEMSYPLAGPNDDAEHAALQPAAEEERRRREELSTELGRLESERDSAAQAAKATIEESAHMLAQLEELHRGKAASDAAAQGLEVRVADLERQFSWSMEARSKLQAELEGMRQRATVFARMALDL